MWSSYYLMSFHKYFVFKSDYEIDISRETYFQTKICDKFNPKVATIINIFQ